MCVPGPYILLLREKVFRNRPAKFKLKLLIQKYLWKSGMEKKGMKNGRKPILGNPVRKMFGKDYGN